MPGAINLPGQVNFVERQAPLVHCVQGSQHRDFERNRNGSLPHSLNATVIFKLLFTCQFLDEIFECW